MNSWRDVGDPALVVVGDVECFVPGASQRGDQDLVRSSRVAGGNGR